MLCCRFCTAVVHCLGVMVGMSDAKQPLHLHNVSIDISYCVPDVIRQFVPKALLSTESKATIVIASTDRVYQCSLQPPYICYDDVFVTMDTRNGPGIKPAAPADEQAWTETLN